MCVCVRMRACVSQHLYPSICWWTLLSLLPYFGNCKIMLLWTLGCMYFFFNYCFCFVLDIHSRTELLGHIALFFFPFCLFFFFFKRSLHTVFHNGCTNLTFPPIVCKGSPFSTASPIFVIYRNLCFKLSAKFQRNSFNSLESNYDLFCS